MKTMRILLFAMVLLTMPVWAQGDGTVSLPLAEFLQLTGQAQGTSTETGPPVPYLLSHGDYRLEATEDWMEVQATLTLQVLGSRWTEVPLLDGSAVLAEARLEGKPVSVYNQDGQHRLMVKGAGTRKLELVYYLPVTNAGPARQASVQTPGSAVSRMTVVLPHKNVKLTSNPPLPFVTRQDGGRTVAQGLLPSQGAAQLSWTPRQAGATAAQQVEKPRLYGRLYQLVKVTEKAVRCTVRVDYSIVPGEVDSYRLTVPPGVEVLNVDCTNLDRWDVVEGKLVVSLSSPVSDNQTLTLLLERPLEDVNSTWEVPVVKLEGVERVKGSIGVTATGGIEVSPSDQQEVRPIDVTQLPPPVAQMSSSPLLLAYEYHEQPFQVDLSTTKGKELAVLTASIDRARARTLVTEDGKFATSLVYDIRNNHKQSLVLSLPEGAEVWSCFVDGSPVKPVEESQGKVRLPLILSSASGDGMTSFPVELTYLQRGPATQPIQQRQFVAPGVDVPISEFLWAVYLPEDREILRVTGSMDWDRPVPLPVPAGSGGGWTGRMSESAPRSQAPAPPPPPVSGESSGLIGDRHQGFLPVRVQLPQAGQVLSFSKLMVTQEMPTITILDASPELGVGLEWLIFGAVLLLGAGRVRKPEGLKLLAGAWVVVVLAPYPLTMVGRALILLTIVWMVSNRAWVQDQVKLRLHRRQESSVEVPVETPETAPAVADEVLTEEAAEDSQEQEPEEV